MIKFSLLSDLEREVELGILHADDPHNSCLAFHRNIVDLKNYITYPQATNFMEVCSVKIVILEPFNF